MIKQLEIQTEIECAPITLNVVIDYIEGINAVTHLAPENCHEGEPTEVEVLNIYTDGQNNLTWLYHYSECFKESIDIEVEKQLGV